MDTEFKQTRRSFLKSSAAVIGGSAGLAACASSTRTSPRASNLYPRHNERTKGWMRFIWDKATTDDNWSYSEGIERPWGINIPRGDIDFTIRDDRPHPWWDQYSSAPMLSYPRFDLSDSSPLVFQAHHACDFIYYVVALIHSGSLLVFFF